ncbi:MAG: hypothetical protein AAF065_06100 [Verrucomicrobiota bacterium]
MRETISHPKYPEQLYHLDESAARKLKEEKEAKSPFVQGITELFTAPRVRCSKCGKDMKKKWMNEFGGSTEQLFLVCDDCHLFVDCMRWRD